jgi:LAO/AO transport system kinase
LSDRADPGALDALRAGGKRAMASTLAALEAAPSDPGLLALLDAAYLGARADVIGITGPPGVGKSTLTSALIGRHRRQGRTVGVVAVDPSSRRSGGALLGDRMRLDLDPEDQGIFVRSMAARERLGGLASLTYAVVVLMRSVYDVVLVETVGVGQSETDVAGVCDTVVLCLQPASGDSLQYMKAGIAEIPDIAVVNKADLGRPARQAKADLEAVLAPERGSGWRVPVLLVSATEGSGLDELARELRAHAAYLAEDGRLAARREAQGRMWLEDSVREAYGRIGLERAARLPGGLALAPGQSPFRRLHEVSRGLDEQHARACARRPLQDTA